MYLNEKQVKALGIAGDALQCCLESNIDVEKSIFAMEIIGEMKRKDREAKQKKKNKKLNK